MDNILLEQLSNKENICFDCVHLYGKEEDGHIRMTCECNDNEKLENKKQHIQVYKNRIKKVVICNLFEKGEHPSFLEE